MKKTLLFALILLYFLHNDVWLWHDASIILGLPVGLVYHIVYCLAASALFAMFVKYAWPSDLESEATGQTEQP